MLARARRTQPDRAIDLVFLTIGANDIYFSGLVADVIIEADRRARAVPPRRRDRDASRRRKRRSTRRCRRTSPNCAPRSSRLLGGRLDKVVFTSYGNPALSPDGGPCPGGRDGFDVHPAFNANAERMRKVALFVQNRFLPAIKALATCTGGVTCATGDRMTFADAHQAAFAQHGMCARADDRSRTSTATASRPTARASPTTRSTARPTRWSATWRPSEFRAYASRARWIRTANDSYFAAMTFPEGVSSTMQPSDLHDATWGILSAVYGGAIHPTAEGYAAMADAALAGARAVLQLVPAVGAVLVEPLPPPAAPADTQGR